MVNLFTELRRKCSWGLRVQVLVLAHMVAGGFGPYQVGGGRNGCPVHVPSRTICNWWSHFEEFGEPPAITRKYVYYKRKRRQMNPYAINILKEIIDNNPMLFLDEMQEELYRRIGIRYSLRVISLSIKRSTATGGLGYSNKILEERAAQACEQEQFLYKCCIAVVPDPRMLCFIDETHKTRRDGRRRRGWGARGLAIIRNYLFSTNAASNYTLIGAVDINGFIKEACKVVWRKRNENDHEPTRGTVDQQRFVQYIRDDLVPLLGRFDNNEPRSVVVLDNASVHKHPDVVNLIEGAGAKIIWTAPYSPWLNPIEHCFACYKKRLARLEFTQRDLYTRHLHALDCVDHDAMINMYRAINVQNLDIIKREKAAKKRKRVINQVIVAAAVTTSIAISLYKRRRVVL